MTYKIGLKLYSKNLSSIEIAREYYSNKLFNYLELMALPGSYHETIKYWKRLHVPYVIHAPIGKYGFNLSLPNLRRPNAKLFCETRKFADALGADHIIVHCGLTGSIEETAHQINGIGDKRIVVENNPFLSLFQTRCVGSSPEEMEYIMKRTGAKACLDIVHAVKTAYANGKVYMEYIKRFLLLEPIIVHLCDCKIKGCFDEHLNFGSGELDYKRILSLIIKRRPGTSFTLEVPEKSFIELKGFKKGQLFLKKYC